MYYMLMYPCQQSIIHAIIFPESNDTELHLGH